MSNEILTAEQVGDLYHDWSCFFKDNPGSAALCIRAIEQAVLQSPEMQQRMEAHASAKVQEILHEEAKPDNIKRAEYYGEGYADGWKSALEKAARLVDGCHPKATRKGIATAIRALMPR